MKSIVPGILALVVVGCGITNSKQVAKETPSSKDTPSGLHQIAPKGYTIPEDSISPDRHYGVTVPITFEKQDDEGKNSLIDLRTGRVLAEIQAKFTGWSRQPHGEVLPARWSKDGSLLLWEVSGKWSPMALTLLKIDNGRVVWQTDIQQAAEKQVLKATRTARPEAYATGKKWNEGNGSAYPEGFTVDVMTEEKPLVLPLWISTVLTANPKGIEDGPNLESYLLGTVDGNGNFVVKDFQFELPKSPHFIDSESFH